MEHEPEHFQHDEEESGCSDVTEDGGCTAKQVQKTNHLLAKLMNQLKKIDHRVKAIEDKLDSGNSTVKKSQRKRVPPVVRVSVCGGSLPFIFAFLCVFTLDQLDSKLLSVACVLSKHNASFCSDIEFQEGNQPKH